MSDAAMAHGGSVELSVVVVAYDMARELPRTLRSLAPRYQRGISSDRYEIVVVDNGSPQPLTAPSTDELGVAMRLHRIGDAAGSPAAAANTGVGLASGELVGLIVDGARMASPGLLSTAVRAGRISPRAVITAPAWHLGPGLQIDAASNGYDQSVEDLLLDRCGWETDGYELFSVATPAASSHRGLFGAMGESSSLFMCREMWAELGGLDERFSLPGGGLVNHDLYRRACALPDSQLVVLLGEGTFHQIHGGAATSGRITRDEMRTEYEAIREEPHSPPSNRPIYLGAAPAQYLPYLAASLELARASDPACRPQPAGRDDRPSR